MQITQQQLGVGPWRTHYFGARDTISTSGYAAPSWHTFTSRSWWRDVWGGGQRLELKNLTNEYYYNNAVTMHGERRSILYEVKLIALDTTYVWVGPNWTMLIKEVKAYADELVNRQLKQKP